MCWLFLYKYRVLYVKYCVKWLFVGGVQTILCLVLFVFRYFKVCFVLKRRCFTWNILSSGVQFLYLSSLVIVSHKIIVLVCLWGLFSFVSDGMCLYIDVSRETFTVANYLVFLSVVIVSRETILGNGVIGLCGGW